MKVRNEDFAKLVKNTQLVSPTKGEEKGCSTAGQIFVTITEEVPDFVPHLTVFATDDILACVTKIPISGALGEPKEYPEFIIHQAELAKLVDVDGNLLFDVDKLPEGALVASDAIYFWKVHVWAAIVEEAATETLLGVTVNPDRLRKLSLLEPRGLPAAMEFVEWADHSIIRWAFPAGGITKGVYMPVDVKISA